ncbi:MAG: amidohydrolase family protein [bacterium]|nr:amidohydrolase family protein [bacterium]
MEYLIVNANIITPITDTPITNNPQLYEYKQYCISLKKGTIEKIGKYQDLRSRINKETKIIDISNHYLCPGFIDCHTHLLFDGKRIPDFLKRQQGKTYQEIAQEGGGIKYTVNQTINSPNLKKLLIQRIKDSINNGTTLIEIKNGYAIEIDKEIEHLKLIKEISKFSPIKIIPTFLAHIPPENFNEYVENLGKKKSEIKSLTEFFDIFCDKTAFSVKQTLKIIEILKDQNFYFRFHTNEFAEDGLIKQLYLNYGNSINIRSFDHLLVLPEETADIIQKLKAFAVIMPPTSWFLGKEYSPVNKLLERDIPICLATDYNAGSSNVISMLMVCNLSSIYLKLQPEKILSYITANPAFLLNVKAGQIREKYMGIFNILKTDNWQEICFSLDKKIIEPLILL